MIAVEILISRSHPKRFPWKCLFCRRFPLSRRRSRGNTDFPYPVHTTTVHKKVIPAGNIPACPACTGSPKGNSTYHACSYTVISSVNAPWGERVFSIKRCPRGEQSGRGDFVLKKKKGPGEKTPRIFRQKTVFSTHPPDSYVARFPAAAHLALNKQRCRVSTASTSKHTRSKGRTTLGDACTLRRGVVVTRSRRVAPLTPNERVQRLGSTASP